MASRRGRRRTECGSKRRFDKDEAFKEATRLRRLWPGESMDAYQCAHCGAFHVGHRPRKVQQSISSRRKRDEKHA